MDPPQSEQLTPDTWAPAVAVRQEKEWNTQQIKELQSSVGAEPCSVLAPGWTQKHILQFRFPVESGLGDRRFQGRA